MNSHWTPLPLPAPSFGSAKNIADNYKDNYQARQSQWANNARHICICVFLFSISRATWVLYRRSQVSILIRLFFSLFQGDLNHNLNCDLDSAKGTRLRETIVAIISHPCELDLNWRHSQIQLRSSIRIQLRQQSTDQLAESSAAGNNQLNCEP